MLSKEVLDLLKITRPTLTKYVKNGIIKVSVLPNGRYDYCKEDVLKIFNKGIERKTYIIFSDIASGISFEKRKLRSF